MTGGGYVLDVDVNDGVSIHDSGISFPVMRKEYREQALNQAQQDHERRESIQQDVHGENQSTLEHVKVKVLQKPYTSPRRRNASPMKPHIVCFRAWCEICVMAKSPDGKHAK